MRSSNALGIMLKWMYTSMIQTDSAGFFFAAQCNLIRLLRTYHACQIPIVLAIAASLMTLYNLTLLDIMFTVGAGAAASFEFGSSYMIEQLGESAGRFASTIALLYCIFVCIGVSPWLFWDALLKIAMSVSEVARRACLEISGVNLAPTVSSAETQPGAHAKRTTPTAMCAKTSASTITVEKPVTETSSGSSSSSVTGAPQQTTGVCQAHLVALDEGADVYLAARPCVGKHLRNVPLMKSDRLPHLGKFVVNRNGSVIGCMRRNHNEMYKDRTTELKCRRKDCFAQ